MEIVAYDCPKNYDAGGNGYGIGVLRFGEVALKEECDGCGDAAPGTMAMENSCP